MLTNSPGKGLRIPFEEEFAAFERLPRRVREALANMPLKMAAAALDPNWTEAEMLWPIAERTRRFHATEGLRLKAATEAAESPSLPRSGSRLDF